MKKLLLGLLSIGTIFGAYTIYNNYSTYNYNYINVGILNDAGCFASVSGNRANGIEPIILESIVDLMNQKAKCEDITNNTTSNTKCEKIIALKYKSYSNIDDLVKAIKSNEVSIGAGAITIHPNKDIKFSNSFQKVHQVILTKNNKKISSISQLKDMKIGVKINSTGEALLKSKMSNAIIIADNSITNLVKMLQSDKIDAIIIDNVLANDLNIKNNLAYNIYNITESKNTEYGFILSDQLDINDFNKKLSTVLSNQHSKPSEK